MPFSFAKFMKSLYHYHPKLKSSAAIISKRIYESTTTSNLAFFRYTYIGLSNFGRFGLSVFKIVFEYPVIKLNIDKETVNGKKLTTGYMILFPYNPRNNILKCARIIF